MSTTHNLLKIAWKRNDWMKNTQKKSITIIVMGILKTREMMKNYIVTKEVSIVRVIHSQITAQIQIVYVAEIREINGYCLRTFTNYNCYEGETTRKSVTCIRFWTSWVVSSNSTTQFHHKNHLKLLLFSLTISTYASTESDIKFRKLWRWKR